MFWSVLKDFVWVLSLCRVKVLDTGQGKSRYSGEYVKYRAYSCINYLLGLYYFPCKPAPTPPLHYIMLSFNSIYLFYEIALRGEK